MSLKGFILIPMVEISTFIRAMTKAESLSKHYHNKNTIPTEQTNTVQTYTIKEQNFTAYKLTATTQRFAKDRTVICLAFNVFYR